MVTQGENKCQDGVKYKELQENLRTSTVLFVENTKGGELAERMRTTLKRIEEILGYRVKVVERSGTPLKKMFPLTKIGKVRSVIERTAGPVLRRRGERKNHHVQRGTFCMRTFVSGATLT